MTKEARFLSAGLGNGARRKEARRPSQSPVRTTLPLCCCTSNARAATAAPPPHSPVVAKETCCCCCCFADSVHPPLSLAASEPHLNQGVSGVIPGHESTLRHILFFHELGESTSLPGLQNKIQEAQYLKLRRFYLGHIYRKTIRLS